MKSKTSIVLRTSLVVFSTWSSVCLAESERLEVITSCHHADYQGFLNDMSNEKCPWDPQVQGTDQALCEPRSCVYQGKCFKLEDEVDIYVNDRSFGRAKCSEIPYQGYSGVPHWHECYNPDLNSSDPAYAVSTVRCDGIFERGDYNLSEKRFEKPKCDHTESAYVGQETFATWQNNLKHPLSDAFDGNDATYYMACAADCPYPIYNYGFVVRDLGAVKTISSITLKFNAWGAEYPGASPCEFSIHVSRDRSTWENVYSRSYNCSPTDANSRSGDVALDLKDVQGRYVELRHTTINDGTGWCLALSEFQVRTSPEGSQASKKGPSQRRNNN